MQPTIRTGRRPKRSLARAEIGVAIAMKITAKHKRPRNFSREKCSALLARYRAVRPMSESEIAALPVLARGAALRFLLTRLHDWLNRDPNALVRPKNPRERLNQLRFHRTVSSAADYGVQ